jgi:hypothetical protein
MRLAFRALTARTARPDGNAFYTLSSLRRAAALEQSKVLKPYDRLAARPAVRAALETEGLQ